MHLPLLPRLVAAGTLSAIVHPFFPFCLFPAVTTVVTVAEILKSSGYVDFVRTLVCLSAAS